MDERAFRERHALEEPLDACADVHVLEAFGLPDQFGHHGHVLANNLGDEHFGRRWWRSFFLFAARDHQQTTGTDEAGNDRQPPG